MTQNMDEKNRQLLVQATQLIQQGAVAAAIKIGRKITHPVSQSAILASAYMLKKNYKDAQTHFRRLKAAMPNEPVVYENLAICRAHLIGGKYDEECEKLIAKAFPNNSIFQNAYTKAIIETDTPVSAERRPRFEWLIEQYSKTRDLEGSVAECGCWRGTSMLLLCGYEASLNSDFKGANFHIFDSFEGLSTPGEKDPLDRPDSKAGTFEASLDEVKRNLRHFPELNFYKGWIPDRFSEVEQIDFHFVHIDVDLHQPTDDSLRFFFPRLVPGGRLVCDDYSWSGAREAVDVYAKEVGAEVFVSPKQQGMLIKENT